MDWFKVDADIGTNPKIDDLSDGAYRAVTYLWGYAMRHETGGRVPPNVTRLIPRVTQARMRELEAKGFIHPNAAGWTLHHFDEHQEEAVKQQARKKRDRERKRAERAARDDV